MAAQNGKGFRFVFTNNFKAKLKAVSKAGELCVKAEVANANKAAVMVVQEFQQGIRNNRLGLRKLRPATVSAKRRQKMVLPSTPLYGLGDYHRDTLINSLYVRPYGGGHKKTTVAVMVSKRAHHHEGKGKRIRLDALLWIHEHGAFIKRGGTIIALPPRPALRIAWERAIRKVRAQHRAPKMKAALTELLNHQREARLVEMQRYTVQERRILDRHD